MNSVNGKAKDERIFGFKRERITKDSKNHEIICRNGVKVKITPTGNLTGAEGNDMKQKKAHLNKRSD